MKQVSGVLNELGDSTVRVAGSRSLTTYSYVVLDDRHLPKLRVFNGVQGKLTSALGQNVTLHIQNGRLCAIKTNDGTLFASSFGLGISIFILMCAFWIPAVVIWLLITAFLLLGFGVGVALGSLAIGGPFAFLVYWEYYPILKARMIPNSIVI
jgi:hypothetical protein